MVGYMIR